MTVAGRLATEVMRKTTPKGQDLAILKLAVPLENHTTRYETILVFGERVPAVLDFQTGDPLECVGYVHERQVTGQDGKTRTKRELYATLVRGR